MAPSSSGPGRQVLILKIAGSTPAGVTKCTLTSVVFAEVILMVTFYKVLLVRFPLAYCGHACNFGIEWLTYTYDSL